MKTTTDQRATRTLNSVPTLPRKQQTTIQARTSFTILKNVLHFPQNIHYQQEL